MVSSIFGSIPEGRKIALCRISPFLAEDEVVFHRAPLVAVAFDPHTSARVLLEPPVVSLQYLCVLRPYDVSVEVEVDVFQGNHRRRSLFCCRRRCGRHLFPCGLFRRLLDRGRWRSGRLLAPHALIEATAPADRPGEQGDKKNHSRRSRLPSFSLLDYGDSSSFYSLSKKNVTLTFSASTISASLRRDSWIT